MRSDNNWVLRPGFLGSIEGNWWQDAGGEDQPGLSIWSAR